MPLSPDKIIGRLERNYVKECPDDPSAALDWFGIAGEENSGLRDFAEKVIAEVLKDVAAAVKELREKAEMMRVTHRADKRDWEGCDETCENECRWVESFQKLIDSVLGSDTKSLKDGK